MRIYKRKLANIKYVARSHRFIINTGHNREKIHAKIFKKGEFRRNIFKIKLYLVLYSF